MVKIFHASARSKKKTFSVKTDKYAQLCNECCREYLGVVSEILERYRRQHLELINTASGPRHPETGNG